MTLVAGVLAMVMLSTTTAALLMVSATEPQIANNLLLGSQAFYIAESGLEIALVLLRSGAPPDVQASACAGGAYTIRFMDNADGSVWVHAEGRIGNARRLVTNRFARDDDGVWQPLREFREEAV